jgi:hypothetical protein
MRPHSADQEFRPRILSRYWQAQRQAPAARQDCALVKQALQGILRRPLRQPTGDARRACISTPLLRQVLVIVTANRIAAKVDDDVFPADDDGTSEFWVDGSSFG